MRTPCKHIQIGALSSQAQPNPQHPPKNIRGLGNTILPTTDLKETPAWLLPTWCGPVTLMEGGRAGNNHSSPTIHCPDDVEASGHKVPVIPSCVAELRYATGALDYLHF